jgi:hypothetical protein
VVGYLVGDFVGYPVGLLLGVLVGYLVGDFVGYPVGLLLGVLVGYFVGDLVGVLVGNFVGEVVGLFVGYLVGGRDGTIDVVGLLDGVGDGSSHIVTTLTCPDSTPFPSLP